MPKVRAINTVKTQVYNSEYQKFQLLDDFKNKYFLDMIEKLSLCIEGL